MTVLLLCRCLGCELSEFSNSNITPPLLDFACLLNLHCLVTMFMHVLLYFVFPSLDPRLGLHTTTYLILLSGSDTRPS